MDLFWNHLGPKDQNRVRMSYYALNCSPWEESIPQYFVPYDCLEDLASYWGPSYAPATVIGPIPDSFTLPGPAPNVRTKADLDKVTFRFGFSRMFASRLEPDWGFTAIHYAALQGWAHVLREYVTIFPDLGAMSTGHDSTTLHFAALSGSMECIELCLEYGGVVDVTKRNRDGYSVLDCVVFSGNISCIDFLWNKVPKADLQVMKIHSHHTLVNDDNLKLSPLGVAALRGSLECLQHMYRLYADLKEDTEAKAAEENVREKFSLREDNDDETSWIPIRALTVKGDVVHAALLGGSWECVQYVMSQNDEETQTKKLGFSELLFAGVGGSIVCLKQLLDHINQPDILKQRSTTDKQYTLAMAAALGGSVECLEFLVANKVDVSVKGKDGLNPGFFAILAENTECLRFLNEHGVSVTEPMDQGQSCAMIAAAFGSVSCLEYIVSIDPVGAMKPAKNGMTVLMGAAFGGDTETIRYVLNHNMGNVNDVGSDLDANPLMGVIASGNLNAVKMLVEEYNMPLKYGDQTALDLCKRQTSRRGGMDDEMLSYLKSKMVEKGILTTEAKEIKERDDETKFEAENSEDDLLT